MLNILRKKKIAKRILIILSLIIIPAFVFWGAGSAIRSKRNPLYVGIAFGRKITFNEYEDNLRAVRNLAIMRFGEDFNKIKDYLNLHSQAWDRILLINEAKKRHIKIPNSKVVEKVRSLAFFQEDGRFSIERYNNVLRYGFRTLSREFEEQIRETLMIEELYKELTRNITLSDKEIREEYRKANEKVKVEYIAALPGDFISEVEPSEEDLKTFFQENPEKFKIDLAVDIEYIGLDYPQEATEEIKEEINKRMEKISKKISPAEDFKKISEENNLRIKETGFFSMQEPIPGIGFSPYVFETIAKLKKNEISEAIPTAGGCYILKIKEKKENYLPRFEEVKTKVNDMLRYKLAKDRAQMVINECFRKIEELRKTQKDISFKELAEEFDLKWAISEPFSRNSYISGIGNYEEFWKAAFRLTKEEEISKPVETPSGFYILRLKEFIGIDEEKFLQEKGKFSQQLLEEKKEERLQTFITDLRKRANLKILRKSVPPTRWDRLYS